mgnify:CR=1 FL=1|tara:strand:+ start:17158 stop:18735 length:1578 start_codon:yes stop_codon:yes gene_type:complete
MKETKYKVCILAAGKGTRNTKYINLHKALLPLGNKATISIIIESFPKDVPFVIAVGYKSEQVKSYLNYTHPDREIEFVNIENYDGPGSGPGLSLYRCKDYLQCPFIFLGADTLIDFKENATIPDRNWIGVGDCSKWSNVSKQYCMYDKTNGFYYSFIQGSNPELNNCFVGVAGLNDYEGFWSSLKNTTQINGEHQVLNGFSNLKDIESVRFNTWRDTGNNESYEYVTKQYNNIVEPKPDEALFIDNKKVLKYFDSKEKVSNRVKRSEILQPNVPVVTKLDDNIFGYDYIPGKRFSDLLDLRQINKFFQFFKEIYLDKKVVLKNPQAFRDNCNNMYKNKTFSRVFSHKEFDNLDSVLHINGVKVSPVSEMLDRIDWTMFVDNAIPVTIHGDMSPENILYDPEKNKFTLIDWRDKFGDDLFVGDAYYDLCKLDHALIVNGEIIRSKKYSVLVKDESAEISIDFKSNLIDARMLLKDFCLNNSLDFSYIKLLTAITLLNISSVHSDDTFNRFLFLYGKLLLTEHFANE